MVFSCTSGSFSCFEILTFPIREGGGGESGGGGSGGGDGGASFSFWENPGITKDNCLGKKRQPRTTFGAT